AAEVAAVDEAVAVVVDAVRAGLVRVFGHGCGRGRAVRGRIVLVGLASEVATVGAAVAVVVLLVGAEGLGVLFGHEHAAHPAPAGTGARGRRVVLLVLGGEAVFGAGPEEDGGDGTSKRGARNGCAPERRG